MQLKLFVLFYAILLLWPNVFGAVEGVTAIRSGPIYFTVGEPFTINLLIKNDSNKVLTGFWESEFLDDIIPVDPPEFTRMSADNPFKVHPVFEFEFSLEPNTEKELSYTVISSTLETYTPLVNELYTNLGVVDLNELELLGRCVPNGICEYNAGDPEKVENCPTDCTIENDHRCTPFVSFVNGTDIVDELFVNGNGGDGVCDPDCLAGDDDLDCGRQVVAEEDNSPILDPYQAQELLIVRDKNLMFGLPPAPEGSLSVSVSVPNTIRIGEPEGADITVSVAITNNTDQNVAAGFAKVFEAYEMDYIFPVNPTKFETDRADIGNLPYILLGDWIPAGETKEFNYTIRMTRVGYYAVDSVRVLTNIGAVESGTYLDTIKVRILCNTNGVCEEKFGENYEVCPDDCNIFADNECYAAYDDGICDPDCNALEGQLDFDCPGIYLPDCAELPSDPFCFCNHNGLCGDVMETVDNCPEDCNMLSVLDGVCNNATDRFCDVDCFKLGTQDYDCPDNIEQFFCNHNNVCQSKRLETNENCPDDCKVSVNENEVNPYLFDLGWLFAVIAAVIVFLVFFLFLRKNG